MQKSTGSGVHRLLWDITKAVIKWKIMVWNCVIENVKNEIQWTKCII